MGGEGVVGDPPGAWSEEDERREYSQGKGEEKRGSARSQEEEERSEIRDDPARMMTPD